MRFADFRVHVPVLIAATAAFFLADGRAFASEPRSAADAELFDRLDVDHDGQLRAREVTTDVARLFARLLRRADVNGDQALSREGFIAGLVPSRPEKPREELQPASFPQADAVRWLLISMDTDGNSRIDEKEVPEPLLRVFDRLAERLDRNKDRILDRRELN